jgi:transposase
MDMCGLRDGHRRDVNAAKNILRVGLDTLAEGAQSTLGGDLDRSATVSGEPVVAQLSFATATSLA